MERLGVNITGLIWQAINFGLLVALLYFLLFKRVIRMLDERRARIQKSMEDAEIAARKAAEAQAEFDRRIEQAKQEAQQILAQATATGQQLREDILAQAREEAQALIEKARQEIARERQQAMAELQARVVDLALLMTRKVVKQTLDEQTHRRLIQDFLAETGEWKWKTPG